MSMHPSDLDEDVGTSLPVRSLGSPLEMEGSKERQTPSGAAWSPTPLERSVRNVKLANTDLMFTSVVEHFTHWHLLQNGRVQTSQQAVQVSSNHYTPAEAHALLKTTKSTCIFRRKHTHADNHVNKIAHSQPWGRQ